MLDLKSHYSIKQAYGSPTYLVENAKLLGYKALGLTDCDSISGCIEFVKACKSNNIKPILGCTFRVKEGGQITLIAKNLDGWKSLIKLVSLSYTKEYYDTTNETPYITIELLSKHKNLVGILGFPEDIISTRLFDKPVYHLSIEEIKSHLLADPQTVIDNLIKELDIEIYLGISHNNQYSEWMNLVIKECDYNGVPISNSRYIYKDDYEYFRLLLCSKLKTVKSKLIKTLEDKDTSLLRFAFNNWSLENIKFSNEELYNLEKLVDSIEEYEVLSKPRLPTYPTPNNEDVNDYILNLCRSGWKTKIANTNKVNTPEKQKVYVDRIKEELRVINENDLASYFLIVRDFIDYANSKGWRCGPGRGSACGCLVSYLIGITKIDSIEYGLSFQRFFNDSRKGSLPDIDTDVPTEYREEIIEYIRNKYGKDRVGHLATYAELKGASAIKEVLRINDVCSFEQMNEITKQIPEVGKVADEMEATGEDSLLLFTLKYRPDKLKDWARYENDEIVGDYAEWFKIAIKLEGTIQSIGKHASAIIVFDEPLSNVCPMTHDKSGTEPMVSYEMHAAEAVGCTKIDILGLSSASKIIEINNILKERSIFYT